MDQGTVGRQGGREGKEERREGDKGGIVNLSWLMHAHTYIHAHLDLDVCRPSLPG